MYTTRQRARASPPRPLLAAAFGWWVRKMLGERQTMRPCSGARVCVRNQDVAAPTCVAWPGGEDCSWVGVAPEASALSGPA
jgi:hypothetical protein